MDTSYRFEPIVYVITFVAGIGGLLPCLHFLASRYACYPINALRRVTLTFNTPIHNVPRLLSYRQKVFKGYALSHSVQCIV